MQNQQGVAREAVIAGIIGGTSVAIWFLILDLTAGPPLHTPRVLASAFFTTLGRSMTPESVTMQIVIYSVLHYIAFIILGLLAAMAMRAAQSEQNIVAALVVLFVLFEAAFYGITTLTRADLVNSLSWWQVGIANLIAAVLMGFYLLRAHPEIRGRMNLAADEDLGLAAESEGQAES